MSTDPRLSFGLSADDWGNDTVICAYVDGVQVAGAVKISESYAEVTGCAYHITTHRAKVKPLLCRDKDEAIRWLVFLADLYEGKKP